MGNSTLLSEKLKNLTPEQKEAIKDKLLLLKKKKEELKLLKDKSRKIGLKLEEKEAKLRQYEEDNKILYFGHKDKGYLGKYGKWEPHSLQKKVFDAVENISKKTILMTGANQIGKTLSETCVCMAFLKGYWPWEDPAEVGRHLWESRGWKAPISIRWIGGSWEGHIQKVIIEKGLQEMWPSTWKVYTKKNNLGVIHLWKDLETGSEVQIMSSKQDVREFEGWTGHVSIWDEPRPRDLWIATQRGLIANKGLSFMGATLLNEGWITQDILNKFDDDGFVDRSVAHFSGDIYTSQGFGLDKEGIETFVNQLTDEEREAREKGVPAFLSSLVLKIDKDKNILQKHIGKDFDIPTDWMIDVAIDIGIAKAHDLTFLGTDPRGHKYILFDDTIKGNGEDIGEYIMRKKNRYMLRINRIICDPLAKGDKNNENTVWERIDKVLNRHGFFLEAGAKDKEDGILAINSNLNTINGLPALFFMPNCKRCIKQCLNWVREADTQKPSKKDDDQCENLYRLMLLDTQWEEMESPFSDDSNDNRQDVDELTGY